ncbi:MAG TPA: GNAT family N-acetyltransferase [Ignavibacteriaceae bacterium]|nr:GNAT family N-acetyltransferase [Ignavibacteriaceae bacterium]
MVKIKYRRILNSDKAWIDKFIENHWGSKAIAVHNTVYYPSFLKGFLAEAGKEKTGLITYNIDGKKCEIVSLNSILENKGIGTALVNLVIDEAKEKNCGEIWLVTTNDNIKGLYFYQKIGFQIVHIYLNAVQQSRKLKPEIPLKAANGIPIKDELELSLKIK